MKEKKTVCGGLSDLMINDRGFAFDPNAGESYQVNETGLMCLRAIQKGLSHQAILDKLLKTYGVDELRANLDLDSFFWELERIGWTCER